MDNIELALSNILQDRSQILVEERKIVSDYMHFILDLEEMKQVLNDITRGVNDIL